MTVETITIPANKKLAVEAKIAKLAKKAMKYGNSEITITFSEPFIQSVRDVNGVMQDISMVSATVIGDAPIYEGGWKLLARVELLENGNLVHEVPNMGNEIDARFRTHNNVCEHCMKIRRRNDVFVFEGESGDQVAVGRTCLHDFMGIDNPQKIVQLTAFYENFKNLEEEETMGYMKTCFSVSSILELSAAEIRQNGWVSKSVAMEQGINSTSDVVTDFLYGNPKIKIDVEDQDRDMAKATIEHFKNMEVTGNNYIDNLSVLMSETMVQAKLIGLVASSVSAYKRYVSDKIAKEESNSDFIGSVKERLRSVEVTLVKEIFIGYTNFGEKFLYSFTDKCGNVIAWFTSKQYIEEGSTVIIDATVKEHKVYNDIKQTVVTRAKVK